MTNRKYIVHVAGVSLAAVLIFYAASCDPLPSSVITKIARQYYSDPACVVSSYDVQAPKLPQEPYPIISLGNSAEASGTTLTTTTVSPSPSAEIPPEA